MEWFQSTCQFILNNYEEFVFNTYANRVVRKAFYCLSGTPSMKTEFHKAGLESIVQKETKVPGKILKKNSEILVNFAKIFMAWPQFKDLFQEELTCGLIQSLLTSLKPYDDSLCQIGVANALDAIPAPLNLDDKISAYTLETCISVANEKMYDKIVQKYFKGHMLDMALHPTGNFTIKSLVEYAPTASAVREQIIYLYLF